MTARKAQIRSAEARRIALRAQGLDRAVAANAGGSGALMRVFERVGLVQIDSVNVLVRSHYLPFFSRLGAYAFANLERLVWERRSRRLFEYWGHEASLIPLELHPLFRWRMARAERGEGTWGRVALIAREKPAFVRGILREVQARGPLASGDIAGHTGSGGGWWGWSDVKTALEYLFWSGALTTARRRNFERLYDLPERVFPSGLLALPTPERAVAERELLRIAARALGIATRSDLRDYFRLDADANTRIAELVEAGDLIPTAVEGWEHEAYLARGATLPRTADAHALLSPFDSLVWDRKRLRRLFGFDFRLEIYTPQAKRIHGYYVLPYLHGDRIVARVDLKAHRAHGQLEAIAVHYEDAQPSAAITDGLRIECERLAAWLDLSRVTIPATLTHVGERR